MKCYFGALLLGGLLAACKAGSAASAGPTAPGQNFKLPYQRTIALAAGGSRVQATLTEVDDSRCPQGTTCVWAGKVAVTLTLADAATTQTLHLAIAPQQVDSAQVTLNKKGYWLRLLGVAPYPSETNGSEPRVAAIRLRPSAGKPALKQ